MLVGAVAALFAAPSLDCWRLSVKQLPRARYTGLGYDYCQARTGRGSLPPQRAIVNFAADDVAGLVCIIKHKMKKFQDQARLIDGCLTGTGLKIEPW